MICVDGDVHEIVTIQSVGMYKGVVKGHGDNIAHYYRLGDSGAQELQ